MNRADGIRNLAVLGHKGAGKTSLVEALLYLTRETAKLGRAGEHESGLDDSPEERAHRTTFESRPVSAMWNGVKLNVIDTPGEASFAADARLALAACDAALVCVSARDGVQTGTERALAWIHEEKLPCLLVLTKMDDEHARPAEVLAQLKAHEKTQLALMEIPEGEGPAFHGVIALRTGKAWERPEAPGALAPAAIPPEVKPLVEAARAHLVDEVAGTDDALAETYLDKGDLSQQELDAGARRAVREGKLIPVHEVSCTRPNGVVALLDAIVDLLPAPAQGRTFVSEHGSESRRAEESAPFSALVFKTHVDLHAGRVSYLRVLSGTLRPDANAVTSSGHRERIGALSAASAKGQKHVGEASAGDICAVARLKSARTGECVSDEKHPFFARLPAMPPALYARTLVAEGKGVEDKAALALQRLCEEIPGLVFKHDPQSREMLLEGLGALQLDIAVERLRRQSSIDCRLGPPRIAYRETIRGRAKSIEGKLKKQTGGHGQFAVCRIDLEPLPRGQGFVFEDAIVGGVVPRQYIPSVEKGIRRALERGVLAGFPVVDVKARLVDGKYHGVDSSDMAFQQAGARALRAALGAAEPVLLEPVARLVATVPEDHLGDVIGDLNARGSRITSTTSLGPSSEVQALVPLAATQDYEPKLTSMTSGRGTFLLAFDHYDVCPPHTAERVIKESGFSRSDDED